MSTLTKILIVLLTLSSVFLCGIIVTYVANAEDYKQQNKKLKTSLSAAMQRERGANEQYENIKDESERLQTKLNNEIAALQMQIHKLKNDLTNVQREKAKLVQDLSNLASVVETANQTAKQQTELFTNAQDELKKVKAKQIELRKELDDTVLALNEKQAIITNMDADLKRLQEEKAQLQSKLDRFLREFGKEPAALTPVTPKPDKAKPVAPLGRKMDLRGVVTVVDLKNSVAEISIGSAEGVKKGMKFYVTRGPEFICEIWVHYVDTEKAVGELKLVQKQPRVGDAVTTNL